MSLKQENTEEISKELNDAELDSISGGTTTTGAILTLNTTDGNEDELKDKLLDEESHDKTR